jgi:hypothetical protein
MTICRGQYCVADTLPRPSKPLAWGDVSAKTGVQLSVFAAIDELAGELDEQHRGVLQKIARTGAGELLGKAVAGSKLEFD